MDQPDHPSADDEISLLDVLAVIAENIKLLVVGPLFIALCALGITFLLPQKFTSEAIIGLPDTASNSNASILQAAALMASPVVLDPVITKLKLEQGETIQQARQILEKQIKTSVGKDGLLRLDVTAESPQQAQVLANSIIENWLASTVPPANELEELETKLGYAKKGLQDITNLVDQFSTQGLSSLGKPLTRGEAGTGLVAVGELQSRYLNDVLSLSRALKGLSKDVVKQSPTSPTESVSPKKGFIVFITGLVSGFILLVFVFMRQSWRSAIGNLETAQKQARIKRALQAIGWKK